MRITKFTHSCVRIAGDGGALVLDPGIFSEHRALADADAVLVTHEHPDHLDPDAIADARATNPRLRVLAHPQVLPKLAAFGDAVTGVEPGAQVQVAGFQVRAFGGRHAVIHPDIPQVANLAVLIGDGDTNVYHPGDSFTVPDGVAVDTLFVPLHAPWAKLSESIDFVRQVRPRRAYALHDALLTEVGATICDGHLERLSGTDYRRVPPGTTLD